MNQLVIIKYDQVWLLYFARIARVELLVRHIIQKKPTRGVGFLFIQFVDLCSLQPEKTLKMGKYLNFIQCFQRFAKYLGIV